MGARAEGTPRYDPIRPAKFNDDVPALDIAEVAQARPQRLHPVDQAEAGPRPTYPIRATFARCCARAASGHAAAAPPRSAMKFRRLMQMPVKDKAYQRAAVCVTAKLAAKCSDGSIATDRHARDAGAMSAACQGRSAGRYRAILRGQPIHDFEACSGPFPGRRGRRPTVKKSGR